MLQSSLCHWRLVLIDFSPYKLSNKLPINWSRWRGWNLRVCKGLIISCQAKKLPWAAFIPQWAINWADTQCPLERVMCWHFNCVFMCIRIYRCSVFKVLADFHKHCDNASRFLIDSHCIIYLSVIFRSVKKMPQRDVNIFWQSGYNKFLSRAFDFCKLYLLNYNLFHFHKLITHPLFKAHMGSIAHTIPATVPTWLVVTRLHLGLIWSELVCFQGFHSTILVI